jgi:hypothetical protein
MKVVIALQSCGRFDLTTQTLTTFAQHNPQLPDWVTMIHAEDGRVDKRNEKLATEHGFACVSSDRRLGNTLCRKHLIRKAAKLNASHIILLENDWETIRPWPWELIKWMTEQQHIYHMRFWHEWKIPRKYNAWVEAGRQGYVSRHRGRDNANPGWQLFTGAPESIEIGDIHWSAPPAVTRINEALWLHKGVRAESGSIKLSGQIEHKVARVMENVIWHIGEAKRTPEFKR